MAPKSSPHVHFSAKLTAEENKLMLALEGHIQAREGKAISRSDLMRRGLDALAAAEKRRGFKL